MIGNNAVKSPSLIYQTDNQVFFNNFLNQAENETPQYKSLKKPFNTRRKAFLGF